MTPNNKTPEVANPQFQGIMKQPMQATGLLLFLIWGRFAGLAQALESLIRPGRRP
jgi:hypothetical protein